MLSLAVTMLKTRNTSCCIVPTFGRLDPSFRHLIHSTNLDSLNDMSSNKIDLYMFQCWKETGLVLEFKFISELQLHVLKWHLPS